MATKAELEQEVEALQAEIQQLKNNNRLNDFLLCGDIIKSSISKADAEYDPDGTVEPEVHLTMKKEDADGNADYAVICFPISCAFVSS